MSFTTKIKNEIASLEVSESEKIAELSGFFRNNATIETNKIILTTENTNIVSRIEQMLQETYDISVKVTVTENTKFNRNQLYLLTIEERVPFLLQALSVWNQEETRRTTPESYIVGANEEIRAYLRGCFLCQGSINDPKTSRYHMEFLIDDPSEAVFVQKLLNLFDLNAKLLNRDKGYMIYLKEAEKISDFLKLVKAYQAVLYFEDIRIYRDHKNRTNRLNNCEQANMDKVIQTASEQLKYIEILKKNVGVELLDDKTKELLEYRLKYPEASLQELSEIISLETGKKITKSGLNHRFRKIKALAKRIEKTTD